MISALFLRRVAAGRGRHSVVAFAPSSHHHHRHHGRKAMTTNAIVPPIVPESVMSGEDKTVNRFTRTESIYKLGKHRSNALELVNAVPVIEVSGNIAVCDGGGGALGHPIEYIKLDGRNHEEAVSCIYCGLRYRMKDDHHHHH
ncbi:hypothetical protein ACHAW5_005089 [Stephanodiscus triporus]|uniref:Zinc finger CHCC-type domain-containing protein n=1 Tax=Stephanodiscus triporus TaxID=2934178 RepID=A0ABD3MLX2_9STRA